LRQLQSRGNKTSHSAQFKDAAGEDRGRCSAGRSVIPCTACRLVIDPRARRSLMLTHPGAPVRQNPSIYWSDEHNPAVSVFGARVVTDVETYNTCGSEP
ncbi:hypothetical protein T07_11977, partial [Trichinella nelsoni]